MTVLWDYTGWDHPHYYGSPVTYERGLPWLAEVCATVEDWGAGLGWGRRYVPAGYTAIDSSPSSAPFVDHVADLATWRSEPDGIFMRHVLEHNLNWPVILANAVASFRKRFCLVMFTPFSPRTVRLNTDHPILDISFRREDLTGLFGGLPFTEEHLATTTQYGAEHMFYIERPA